MADEIETTAQLIDLAELRQVVVHELVANRDTKSDLHAPGLPPEELHAPPASVPRMTGACRRSSRRPLRRRRSLRPRSASIPNIVPPKEDSTTVIAPPTEQLDVLTTALRIQRRESPDRRDDSVTCSTGISGGTAAKAASRADTQRATNRRIPVSLALLRPCRQSAEPWRSMINKNAVATTRRVFASESPHRLRARRSTRHG